MPSQHKSPPMALGLLALHCRPGPNPSPDLAATPRHATPRHATPRHATPRHATPPRPSEHAGRWLPNSNTCNRSQPQQTPSRPSCKQVSNMQGFLGTIGGNSGATTLSELVGFLKQAPAPPSCSATHTPVLLRPLPPPPHSNTQCPLTQTHHCRATITTSCMHKRTCLATSWVPAAAAPSRHARHSIRCRARFGSAPLPQTYCGPVGYEFSHVTSLEKQNWLREKVERQSAPLDKDSVTRVPTAPSPLAPDLRPVPARRSCIVA